MDKRLKLIAREYAWKKVMQGVVNLEMWSESAEVEWVVKAGLTFIFPETGYLSFPFHIQIQACFSIKISLYQITKHLLVELVLHLIIFIDFW